MCVVTMYNVLRALSNEMKPVFGSEMKLIWKLLIHTSWYGHIICIDLSIVRWCWSGSIYRIAVGTGSSRSYCTVLPLTLTKVPPCSHVAEVVNIHNFVANLDWNYVTYHSKMDLFRSAAQNLGFYFCTNSVLRVARYMNILPCNHKFKHPSSQHNHILANHVLWNSCGDAVKVACDHAMNYKAFESTPRNNST